MTLISVKLLLNISDDHTIPVIPADRQECPRFCSRSRSKTDRRRGVPLGRSGWLSTQTPRRSVLAQLTHTAPRFNASLRSYPSLFRGHVHGFRCTRHVSLRRLFETTSPSLRGVPSVWFPRFIGTMGCSDSLPLVSPHFVAFVWRCRVGKGRPTGSIELRVSPSPSKIPYGGFSPVRLQMDRQWRPSTTSRGLSAVHIRPMTPSYTPPQQQLPGIRDPRRDYPF